MRATFGRMDIGRLTWIGRPEGATWATAPVETHEHEPWHPPLRRCQPGVQAICADCRFKAGLCTGAPIDIEAILDGTWRCRAHREVNDD